MQRFENSPGIQIDGKVFAASLQHKISMVLTQLTQAECYGGLKKEKVIGIYRATEHLLTST